MFDNRLRGIYALCRWWLESGQLQWAGPGCPHCVTARRWNAPLEFSACGAEAREEQMVEAGRWEAGLLSPLHTASWQARQDSARARQVASAQPGLQTALAELKHETLLHSALPPAGRGRRAAVFYLDRGLAGLAMVRWWLHTWRLIGLHTEAEQFDLVLYSILPFQTRQLDCALCRCCSATPPRCPGCPPTASRSRDRTCPPGLAAAGTNLTSVLPTGTTPLTAT